MPDTADERLAQALADRARRGKRPPELFASTPGEARATLPEMLREAAPAVYGALGGLAGTAPDQFEGSVLDPNTERVREGAKYGFPVGTALQIAPLAGGALVRGASMPKQAGRGQLGMLLPYIKGPKGVPGFQTPTVEKAVDKTVELLRSGKTATEAGKDTGVWLVPRGGNRAKMAAVEANKDNAAFMIEVPDSKLKFSADVLDYLRRTNRGSMGGASWMLDDAIDAPKLFDIAPHMRGARLRMDPNLPSQGSYNYILGQLNINPKLANTDELAEHTARHEIQHGFQYHTNDLSKREMAMPGGGNVEMFARRPSQELVNAYDIEEYLKNIAQKQPNAELTSEQKKLIGFLQTFRQSDVVPQRMGYDRLLGEQQAEAVVARKHLTPEERKIVSPYESYKAHPFKTNQGIDPDDFYNARPILDNAFGVDTETLTQMMLRLLRKPTNPDK